MDTDTNAAAERSLPGVQEDLPADNTSSKTVVDYHNTASETLQLEVSTGTETAVIGNRADFMVSHGLSDHADLYSFVRIIAGGAKHGGAFEGHPHAAGA